MRAFAVRVLRSRRFWLGVVGLFVITVVGLALWLLPDLPDLDRLDDGLKRPSTRIFDRHGALLYEILSPTEGRNTPVTLNDIPAHCRAAVIATEDANFYTHPGVDPVGVLRALWINLRGGEVVAGGSTITQQTARMVFLDPLDRSLKRKLQEMILAVRLETAYSKDEVLALYLNQAYFGSLAYGIEAAARAYFGKSASELSVAECAMLAGVLQAPALYDPLINPDAARERQRVALRLMFERGDLTAAEAARALDEPLAFAAAPFPIQAPHFVMAVWAQLERDYPDRLYRDGLDVYTTLDLSWQQAAERVARQQLFFLNDPNQTERTPVGADSAALVALDPHTGEVLAMLGSPNYFDADISGAVNGTLALRQPGSTLKPFTYAAAMDPDRPNPWTAATVIQDVVTAFTTRKGELYVPTNFGNVEHGPVTVREALASSYNIPAVAALEAVGVRSMVELAARAGMTSLWDNPDLDLAVTLGGGEVRLLDLTQAYAILANGGYRVAPVMITRVAVRGQATLYEWTPPALTERLIDPRVGWLITDMLADDVARTNGFGRNSLLNIGRPAAAKTGTTTDSRDNWVVGYTPSVVVGVWVGNPDNRAMVNATGLTGAGPIWHHFIRQVLAGTPPEPFPQPDGLVRVDICLPSGLLATPDCSTRRAEWFIPGTQPTETLARGVEVVRVVSPFPGAVYQLSAGVPRDTQRIRLTLEAPPDAVRTEYLINGEVFSESAGGWWALVPGEYVAVGRATLADGSTVESAPVRFSVLDVEGG